MNTLKKPILIFAYLIPLTLLILGVYLYFNTSNVSRVNLALNKDNKIYLFSSFGASTTERLIETNQILLNQTPIYQIKNEIYIEPQNLKDIISLFSNNYTIHKQKRKLYSGYVSDNERKKNTYFSEEMITEDGKKIGDLKYKFTIQLKEGTRIYTIKWSPIPNLEAEENCIISSIWVKRNIVPGETTHNIEKIILVKLNDILSFYKNGIKLDYNKVDKILYIVEP